MIRRYANVVHVEFILGADGAIVLLFNDVANDICEPVAVTFKDRISGIV